MIAIAVALLGSEYLSGCAGVVAGSSPSGNPSTSTQGQLSATPASASFPNVAAGSVSSQTITILNNGKASATIANITVTGTGFGTSGLLIKLPLVIAAGQSSAFNVTFTAGASGSASGSILLTSDAANSPLRIAATGSVIAATSSLGVNPASLSFGDVMLGSSSSIAAALTNNGNANVTISGVTTTGAGFGVAGVAANTVLAPGQSAVLNTTFAPTVGGTTSGMISVASDAGSAVTVALSGNGVQASTHAVALNWNASTSDVVGYYVYRQASTDGAFAKLNAAPIVSTAFTDGSVQQGQTYTYVVTAVDADNAESGYSDGAVISIP